MNMIDWIKAGNTLQSLSETELCLEEEIAELTVELATRSGTRADKIKELADVIWCAHAVIEQLGYDSKQVMSLLAKNNASKVYLSRESALDDLYQHHKLGCTAEQFGDTQFFVVVDRNAKIQKPAGFIKLTHTDIDNCKY